MKEFFSLKITNKKLIPALLIFLLLFAASYYILVQQQKEPEIVTDKAPAKTNVTPKKQQTIMVYPSRDPFKPLVEIKKKEVPPKAEEAVGSLPEIPTADLTSIIKTIAENKQMPNAISLQGIITSNNKSSALLHVGNKVQTASVGDLVPGYGKVISITNNQIIIKNESGKMILTVGGEQ